MNKGWPSPVVERSGTKEIARERECKLRTPCHRADPGRPIAAYIFELKHINTINTPSKIGLPYPKNREGVRFVRALARSVSGNKKSPSKRGSDDCVAWLMS